eukprot:11179425-Lingulodinium_polyedra.AAC.1
MAPPGRSGCSPGAAMPRCFAAAPRRVRLARSAFPSGTTTAPLGPWPFAAIAACVVFRRAR